MKKSIKVLLWAVTLCILMPICSKASASPTVTEITQMPKLTDWVLDESASMLYAISLEEKSLLFINTTTMKVEQTLELNGAPTDLLLEGQDLYIALDSKKEIKRVNVNTKTVSETITTKADPYCIVKDGNHIYYAQYNQWCDVYEYDLESNTEKAIAYGLREPDLAVNDKQHILYIGESDCTDSKLRYYSTITGKQIVTPKYETRSSVSNPPRSIYFDGEYVYYAGYKFDHYDASNIEGDFGKRSKFLAVRNGMVYTENGIYDRESHRKLGSYQTQPTLVEASNTAIYIYNANAMKMERFTDGNQKITKENVISLISGSKEESLPETLNAEKYAESYKTLDMEFELSILQLVEETNTVYAISQKEKAIFFINATTMNLEKTVTLKSNPTSISVQDGLVYVALGTAKQIITIDAVSKQIVDQYRLTSYPKAIAVDKDTIYYCGYESVYALDKKSGEEKDLKIGNSCIRTIALDPVNQMLYYADYYSNASNFLHYYDIKNEKYVGKTQIHSETTPEIWVDENAVYYGKYAFNKVDPSKVIGCYDEEDDILLIKNGRAYTEFFIYDAKTFEIIDMNLIEDDTTFFDAYESGKMLYYSEENQLIEMMDEANLVNVIYDSDGGSYDDIIFADKGTLLKEPKVPVRNGYVFLGWYDGEKDNVKWDFAKNVVADDVYLVAKWMKVILAPTNLRAQASEWDMQMMLSWVGSSDAKQYEIYRSTSANGVYTLLATTKDEFYNDRAVTIGGTYYYKVRAVGELDGVKAYSAWSQVSWGSFKVCSPYLYSIEYMDPYSLGIAWEKVVGVDGYEIYRSTSKDGKFTLVASLTKTELQEKSLPLNATYYYKVRAYKVFNNKRVYSAFSNIQTATLKVHRMPAVNPSKLGGNSIRLDWNCHDGSTTYQVYRATNANGPYSYQGQETYYQFSQYGLEYGMTYYYKVRPVVKINGKTYYGEFSRVVRVTTSAKPMSKLKGTAVANGSVNLSYSKVSGMHGYEVYRATSANGSYTFIGTSKGTSYTDKRAAAGQTYYYKVRGFRNVGKDKSYTSYSNAVKVTTVVSVPSRARAAKKNRTSITVSWNGVKDATGYEVYQSTSKYGSYKRIGTTKGKSFASGKLRTGRTYYYKVRAYRQVGKKKVYSKYTSVVYVKLR